MFQSRFLPKCVIVQKCRLSGISTFLLGSPALQAGSEFQSILHFLTYYISIKEKCRQPFFQFWSLVLFNRKRGLGMIRACQHEFKKECCHTKPLTFDCVLLLTSMMCSFFSPPELCLQLSGCVSQTPARKVRLGWDWIGVHPNHNKQLRKVQFSHYRKCKFQRDFSLQISQSQPETTDDYRSRLISERSH